MTKNTNENPLVLDPTFADTLKEVVANEPTLLTYLSILRMLAIVSPGKFPLPHLSYIDEPDAFENLSWTEGFTAALKAYPVFKDTRYLTTVLQLAQAHQQGEWLAAHLELLRFGDDTVKYCHILVKALTEQKLPIAPLVQFILKQTSRHIITTTTDEKVSIKSFYKLVDPADTGHVHSAYSRLNRSIAEASQEGSVSAQMLNEWRDTVDPSEEYSLSTFGRDVTQAWGYVFAGDLGQARHVAESCLARAERLEEMNDLSDSEYESEVLEWWLRLGCVCAQVGIIETAQKIYHNFIKISLQRKFVDPGGRPHLPAWITDERRHAHVGLWVTLGSLLDYSIEDMKVVICSNTSGVSNILRNAMSGTPASYLTDEQYQETNPPVSIRTLRRAAIEYHLEYTNDFQKAEELAVTSRDDQTLLEYRPPEFILKIATAKLPYLSLEEVEGILKDVVVILDENFGGLGPNNSILYSAEVELREFFTQVGQRYIAGGDWERLHRLLTTIHIGRNIKHTLLVEAYEHQFLAQRNEKLPKPESRVRYNHRQMLSSFGPDILKQALKELSLSSN